MTIEEMHTALELELDKSNALDTPSFTDNEKDWWLNSAIKKFVKTRYSGVNTKRESFEETQKRIDDLRTLVKSSDLSLASTSDPYPNGYYSAMPSDYWLTVGEEATISVSGTTSRVGVTQCNQNQYRQKIDDPYSEHILHYGTAEPIRLFYENSVELISDGNYSVSTYHLTYLKAPQTVSLSTSTDCDLPFHTHDEVVRLCANMILENVEQPRYQSHSMEVATME